MDEKTKEIVERLLSYNERQPDHLLWRINILVDVVAAASLIESLSERVGELERLWGERCMTEIESQSALSKQGEGS